MTVTIGGIISSYIATMYYNKEIIQWKMLKLQILKDHAVQSMDNSVSTILLSAAAWL